MHSALSLIFCIEIGISMHRALEKNEECIANALLMRALATPAGKKKLDKFSRQCMPKCTPMHPPMHACPLELSQCILAPNAPQMHVPNALPGKKNWKKINRKKNACAECRHSPFWSFLIHFDALRRAFTHSACIYKTCENGWGCVFPKNWGKSRFLAWCTFCPNACAYCIEGRGFPPYLLRSKCPVRLAFFSMHQDACQCMPMRSPKGEKIHLPVRIA